jgi:SNF2 family DNA or RNA helicase
MRKALIPEFPACQTVLELVDCSNSGSDALLSPWFGQIAVREAQHEQKMDQMAEESGLPYANPAGDILPELLFARMRAELGKTLALIELAREGLAQGHSVVIFINFLYTRAALVELGFKDAGLISGGQDVEERNSVIDAFQADKCSLIIATIDSGGAGISLHDLTGRHPRLALLCPTWRATTLRQALGRVHRAGGKTKTLQKLVYAAGTIEEAVAERVRNKLSQIDLINDSDLAETEFLPQAAHGEIKKFGRE